MDALASTSKHCTKYFSRQNLSFDPDLIQTLTPEAARAADGKGLVAAAKALLNTREPIESQIKGSSPSASAFHRIREGAYIFFSVRRYLGSVLQEWLGWGHQAVIVIDSLDSWIGEGQWGSPTRRREVFFSKS